ncbi:cytochrome b/b6 domain-containing protein [Streptomyces sp. NPDC059063]|uniref:cytochrome b/b6 domain-containing protein n=1 Tax=unclassified Streptomyces TaxID=2593676 RepID=UPI0036D09652
MNPLKPHRKSPESPSLPGTPSLRPFREPSRAARGLLTTAALLLIPLVVFAGGDDFRAALDYTTGVLSLVALTASVAWGLVASDRLFLRSRQRLLAQAVHRATAVASVGFLLLHGTVKLALDHVSFVGALVPFGLGLAGGDGLIGLGSLAGLLMVTTSVTGALRSAFASPVQVASRWRALHMLAYPAWCAALIHGLYAGRPPKTWVVALYCLCLVAVAGAVALRTAPGPVKRKVAARIFALLEPDGRGAPREPRRRGAPTPTRDTSSAPLPGTGSGRGSTPPDTAPVVGIAAAYRALATTSERDAADLPRDLQPTEVLPTMTPRWPTPSPPPPVEAPATPFPYDSVETPHPSVETHYDAPETRYGSAETSYAPVTAPCVPGVARYDTPADGYDSVDTQHDYGDARYSPTDTGSHDTGPQPAYHPPAYEPLHEPPYEPRREAHHEPLRDPAHDDGPATQQLPGPFQAPSTGEPWNAATGGGK